MSGSRLDAAANPLAPLVVYLGELKQGGKVDSWMCRAATLAHEEPPTPAMLERLIGIEPQLNVRVRSLLAEELRAAGARFGGSFVDAAGKLGMERLQRVCLLACLELWTEEQCKGSGVKAKPLVAQALAISVASMRLADRLVMVSRSAAMSGGLLRHLGQPFLIGLAKASYRGVLEAVAGTSRSIQEAETEAFGFNHRAGGVAVAKMWGFPPHGTSAILACHPISQTIDISWCVVAGEAIAHQLGYDGGAANSPPDLPVDRLESVGIRMDDVARLSMEVANEVQVYSKAS
ncbi:MAG: HDOD domain-containing protein [Fimbriimonadales bacterium]|nr:HDOD domain-containing protein [Fimbriimonadales bacterium]